MVQAMVGFVTFIGTINTVACLAPAILDLNSYSVYAMLFDHAPELSP
jgi:hypothetical protein